MSVHEYECMTYYDLNLKIQGFADGQRKDEAIKRMMAYMSLIAPHANLKKLKFDKMWPSPYEGTVEKVDELTDKKEAFKELLNTVQNNGKA